MMDSNDSRRSISTLNIMKYVIYAGRFFPFILEAEAFEGDLGSL